MAFELPPLPYAYDALEPHVDEQTMRLHHDKHHAGYTAKFNDAIAGTELDGLSAEEILGKDIHAIVMPISVVKIFSSSMPDIRILNGGLHFK